MFQEHVINTRSLYICQVGRVFTSSSRMCTQFVADVPASLQVCPFPPAPSAMLPVSPLRGVPCAGIQSNPWKTLPMLWIHLQAGFPGKGITWGTLKFVHRRMSWE